MKYQLGDLFLLDGVEAKVAFINSSGKAYLTPVNDGDYYNIQPALRGVVFAVLDAKRREVKSGKKALVINKHNCGAV